MTKMPEHWLEHWEVDKSGLNIKVCGRSETVALTQPHAKMKQRAKLLAQAPEMCEVLQKTLEYLDGAPDAPDLGEIYTMIENVLAETGVAEE